MPRQRKSQQKPTPIKKDMEDNPILQMAGGAVVTQPPPPSDPQDESLADQLWSELEDEHGEVEISKIPDEYLAELRRRVRDGELKTSMITGDETVAANHWTRSEVGRLMIRYRRRVLRYAIREFIPVLHDQPTERREWVRGSARPDAAARHAANSLTVGLDTAIKLHGGALVAMGLADWVDVENYATRRVSQQCQSMHDKQGMRMAQPTPLAAAGGGGRPKK